MISYVAAISNLREFYSIIFLGVPTSFEVLAEPQGCFLNLSWETPSYNSCPITRYTVHYRQPNQLTKWQTTSFRANRTEYHFRLNCSSTYEIMVLAWNERGSSIKDAKRLTVKTGKGIRVKGTVSRLCAPSGPHRRRRFVVLHSLVIF